MYLNRIELIGRLGKAPEMNLVGNGRTRLTFSLCTSRAYKDSSGESKEIKDWHNVTAWGKLGDVLCGFNLQPGTPLFVAGELHHSIYEKDGIKFDRVDINASEVQILQKKGCTPSRNDAKTEQQTEPDTDDYDLPF